MKLQISFATSLTTLLSRMAEALDKLLVNCNERVESVGGYKTNR